MQSLTHNLTGDSLTGGIKSMGGKLVDCFVILRGGDGGLGKVKSMEGE